MNDRHTPRYEVVYCHFTLNGHVNLDSLVWYEQWQNFVQGPYLLTRLSLGDLACYEVKYRKFIIKRKQKENKKSEGCTSDVYL